LERRGEGMVSVVVGEPRWSGSRVRVLPSTLLMLVRSRVQESLVLSSSLKVARSMVVRWPMMAGTVAVITKESL